MMKTIGIIGGMSWESSSEYYRIINGEVRKRCGGLHSGKVILYSLDFAELESLVTLNQWDEIGRIIAQAAVTLENAGAEVLVIASSTAHKIADYVTSVIHVPLLHIGDTMASTIQKACLNKVGLLGTKQTMTEGYIKNRLTEQYGIHVLIPNDHEQQCVHNIIFNELCTGVIRQDSKEKVIQIIKNLQHCGAAGIILGCTEIELLIKQADSPLPLYPSAEIHAVSAVDFALS